MANWVRLPAIPMSPDRLAEYCGWRVRRVGDIVEVCTEEGYTKAQPNLLTVVLTVLARDASGSDLSLLGQGVDSAGALADIPTSLVEEQIARQSKRQSNVGSWSAILARLIATRGGDLPNEVAKLLSGSLASAFPDLTLKVVQVNRLVLQRCAAVRVLFGASHAAEFMEEQSAAGRPLGSFPSARGLSSSGSVDPGGYVDLPLLMDAPWVTGICASLVDRALVFLLGRHELAREPVGPAELIDHLRTRSTLAVVDGDARVHESTSHDEHVALFLWWVQGLNRLFGVLLDIGNFKNADSWYDPARHLGALLSIDRLMVVNKEILAFAQREEFLRKILLFDALDLLEGVGAGDRRTLLTLSKVQSRLADVKACMPDPAWRAVEGRLTRGVDALQEVANGFYMAARRAPNGGLRVPRKRDGADETISMENAVAQFLSVVRNSTHSFKNIVTDRRDLYFLASHDGELPNDLPDVALVHLLWLMCHPERVRT